MSLSESQRYDAVLSELAKENEDLVVMTAENRIHIQSLAEGLGPRFIDVGICEQTLVGAAAGLALRGRRPFVHALAAFLTMRAFEFIRTDIGLANLPVTLVGFVPGILSEGNGPTHQAIEDIALMRLVPNMQIVCPANIAELTACIPEILRSEKPCYIRYNDKPEELSSDEPFLLGKAEVRGEGTDVVLLCYGVMVAEAEKARLRLEKEGIGTSLINLRTLCPLDEKVLIEICRDAQLVVILQDHELHSGLYDIFLGLMARSHCSVEVLSLGFTKSGFVPSSLDAVLHSEGLNGQRIFETVRQKLHTISTNRRNCIRTYICINED